MKQTEIETTLPSAIRESDSLNATQLNSEQKKIVEYPANAPVQVLAGAGTGKTTVISERYFRVYQELLASGITHPAANILTLTFTVKAAAEMKERITKKLIQSDVTSEVSLDNHWIGNFHQICRRLLKTHGLLIGLNPDFHTISEGQKEILFEALLKDIRLGVYTQIKDVLTQYGLLKHIPENILSLHELRSLWPDTLSELFKSLPTLIQQIKSTGVDPVTFFTQSTAQTTAFTDILTQLKLPDETDSIDCETLSRLWQPMLSPWIDDKTTLWGSDLEYTIFAASKKKQHLDSDALISQFTKDRLCSKSCLSSLVSCYFDINSRKKEPPLSPLPPEARLENLANLREQTAVELSCIKIIAAVYALYQWQLSQQNLCDFDDIILHTLTLLKAYPDLTQAYQNQFVTIIIDEFQDSNGAQLELIQLLKKPDQNNVTVVGDLKQSIYGFRFSQPENMGLVFDQPETHQHQTTNSQSVPKIALPINYRSHPTIVACSNYLSELITLDTAQHVTSVQGETATTAQHRSTIRWITVSPAEETDADKNKSTKIPKNQLRTRLISAVVNDIETVYRSGLYTPEDITVLVPNNALVGELTQALTHQNIPVNRVNAHLFCELPEIKCARNLIKTVIYPENDLSWTGLLQSLLSQKELYLLSQLRQSLSTPNIHQSLFEYFQKLEPNHLLTPIEAVVFPWFQEILRARKQLLRLFPTTLFTALWESLGLSDRYDSDDARQNISLFRHCLSQVSFQRNDSHSWVELVQLLDALFDDTKSLDTCLSEATMMTKSRHGVQILTVHSAKGLEFPCVYVLDLPKRIPPDKNPLIYDPQFRGKKGFGVIYKKGNPVKKDFYKTVWQKIRNQAEEQRLFYVAITRARHHLFVYRFSDSAYWSDLTNYPLSASQHIEQETIHVSSHTVGNLPELLRKEWTPSKAHVPQKSRVIPDPKDRETMVETSQKVKEIKLFDNSRNKKMMKNDAVYQAIYRHYWGLDEHPVFHSRQSQAIFSTFLTSPLHRNRLEKEGWHWFSQVSFEVELDTRQANQIHFSGCWDLLLFHPAHHRLRLVDFQIQNTEENPLTDKKFHQVQLALYKLALGSRYPQYTLNDEDLLCVSLGPHQLQEESLSIKTEFNVNNSQALTELTALGFIR
ncbi:MAG: ATP-dependent helicase [Cyanobacteria bacterium]|nr:ATP-dependent helicase [Cyanobacteriota bacterium]